MQTRLKNAAHRQRERIVEREFLASNVESIESIGAVGAVFEQVFFALGKFLARLILAETFAPAADHCRLNGEYWKIHGRLTPGDKFG